jgi:hypothetical protein
VTLYFFRQNLLGIHESSGKALKIMIATTVMGAVLLAWCGITLLTGGVRNSVPLAPSFHQTPDPLGFLGGTEVGESVRGLSGTDWLSLIGVLGLFIALGHSILAMSGEETLAQVYREVESPKLGNFKKAAFIVFLYSLLFTGGISFLAVLLIPDEVRMKDYADNLVGGLAMNVAGPPEARLLLHAIVVVVGVLILAGAVNTAIVGSHGVLNRVAEDGVLSDWFLRPHPKYGTTYRVLVLVVGLQLCTIVVSRGNVLTLGEAYAFGVVWSFVFKALAMVVLRFKDPRPRQFKVPLNLRVGKYEVPVGLTLIFLVLLASAVMNVLTKETATKWGLAPRLTIAARAPGAVQRARGAGGDFGGTGPDPVPPQAGGRPLGASPGYAGQSPGGGGPRDHRRRRDIRQAQPAAGRRRTAARPERARPAAADGGGGEGGAGGQGGAARAGADEPSAARHPDRGEGAPGRGGVSGRLAEPLRGGGDAGDVRLAQPPRATAADRRAVVSPARRTARSPHRAHRGAGSRGAPGSGRGTRCCPRLRRNYFFFASRKRGASDKVKSTTSSPVWVLMS